MDLINRLRRWCKAHPSCELCQNKCSGTLPLCPGCHTQLPWIAHGCSSCGEPVTQPNTRCTRCQLTPLPFAEVIIPLRYGFPVDQWIGAFKYQERPGMAHWLAQLLADEIRRRSRIVPSVVIGVPMHPQRQRHRGYNQSLLLAHATAKHLTLEFSGDLLRKTRATAHQRTLNATTRQLNLQNAFEITEALKGKRRTLSGVKGQHIALVDDVVTTGATSAEIAQCLLKAGATGVSLWALAKTPMHTPQPSGRHVFFS